MRASSLLTGLAMTVAIAALSACDGGRPADPDAFFLQQEAAIDLREIKMGELAIRYSQLPDVTAYGRQMIDEHQGELAQLSKIAADRQVIMPVSLDPFALDRYFRLAQIGGDEFHRLYMNEELFAHHAEKAVMEQEMTTGGDPRLVAMAKSQEPVTVADTQLALDVEVKNHLNFPLGGSDGGNQR
jgi:predicted outer membrane protein